MFCCNKVIHLYFCWHQYTILLSQLSTSPVSTIHDSQISDWYPQIQFYNTVQLSAEFINQVTRLNKCFIDNHHVTRLNKCLLTTIKRLILVNNQSQYSKFNFLWSIFSASLKRSIENKSLLLFIDASWSYCQQYFSNILVVSFIGGGTQRKPPTCHKSLTNFIT